MSIKFREGRWFEGNMPVSEGYVALRIEQLEQMVEHLREFYGVRDMVVKLWDEGELSPDETLCRQMLRIGELRTELDRAKQERDWQYEENVNRIAAQGAAELAAAKWEWIARKYELYRSAYPCVMSLAELQEEYEMEHPYG